MNAYHATYALGAKYREKVKKYFFLFLSILLILTASCTPAEPSPPGNMVDDLGRSVNINKIPQRIISLCPCVTETLFALGLGEKVVGVTKFCDYPPEVKERECIGGCIDPDLEKIIVLQPDLILAHVSCSPPEELISTLEGEGLTVFILDCKDLEGVLEDILTISKLTGEEKEATELITEMESRTEAITDKTKNLKPEERPRVLYIAWVDPLYISGRGSFIDDLITKAGGENVFSDVEGCKLVDLEEIIARNPQVIMGVNYPESMAEEWAKTEPRLGSVEARKSGRIYAVDTNLVERPGPRIVQGLEQVAKCVHPEIFGLP